MRAMLTCNKNAPFAMHIDIQTWITWDSGREGWLSHKGVTIAGSPHMEGYAVALDMLRKHREDHRHGAS